MANLEFTHTLYLSERFTRIDEPYNKDISDQENAKSKEPFDEDAYLSGQVPIFGDNPSPRPRNGI